MSTARGPVLPPHERSSGEIVEDHPGGWRTPDDRVPGPLVDRRGDSDHEPHVLAHYLRSEECPDGRHLFDVIERISETELDLEPNVDDYGWDRRPSEEYYEYDFRAVLTCVRCGLIREWAGTRTEKRARWVQPAPLVAGDLVAQQVIGSDRDDLGTWTIYRHGARVGALSWGLGSRGRRYHQARLDAWPAGETVEGKDPAAALRAVARAEKRAPSLAATS